MGQNLGHEFAQDVDVVNDKPKPPKIVHVGGPWPCRCGTGQVSACETEDGRPGVVHTEPVCATFTVIDDPVAFLRWLRTGSAADAD